MAPIEALRLCAEALGDGFLKPEGREGYHRSCTACGGDLHGDGHAKDCVIGAAVAAASAALAVVDDLPVTQPLAEGPALRDMRTLVAKPPSQDPYSCLGELFEWPYATWGHLVSELLCIQDSSLRYARCIQSKQLGAEITHHIEAGVHLSDEDFQQVRVNAEQLLGDGKLREFVGITTSPTGERELRFTFVEPQRR